MSTSYAVELAAYAERHFVSSFRKKYRGAWEITWTALVEEFKRIETLLGVNTYIEIITQDSDLCICKTEFRVVGTKESRHGSGNRCIVAIHTDTKIVRVLLVYGKGDVRGPRETAWWQKIIKETYPEYAQYF